MTACNDSPNEITWKNRQYVLLSATLLIFLFLIGCSGSNKFDDTVSMDAPPVLVDNVFTDIPVPENFSMDTENTFVYESGSGTVKVGRLFYSGWGKLDGTVAFYQNEMTNKGWKLVNAMGHDGKVMNYFKQGRVCTLILTSNWARVNVEIQTGPQ